VSGEATQPPAGLSADEVTALEDLIVSGEGDLGL
jgi:hypothetical protein